jgi:1,2-diacylglycerol 3-alpha-glucosyltransferase
MTAFRFAEALRAKGHEVRVVGVGVEGEGAFPVRERRIPIVTAVARRQSTYFGEGDEATLRRAFQGADVVHFLVPWKLSRVGERIAREMGVARTAAFHVQPENVTYGAGLGRLGAPIARHIYLRFRISFTTGSSITTAPRPSSRVSSAPTATAPTFT